MKKLWLRIFAVALLALGVAWAAVEADETKGPGDHAMFMHRGGAMPGCPGGFMGMPMGGDPMMMPMGGGHMMMPMAGDTMHLVHLAEALDLTPDQRKQLGAIMDATTPKLRDLMFRMADAHKALRDYRKSGKKDEAALRRITDEHGKVMSEMMFETMKMHQDLHAVLTEDQAKKLKELKEDMHRGGMRFFNRRMEHMDRGGDDESDGDES